MISQATVPEPPLAGVTQMYVVGVTVCEAGQSTPHSVRFVESSKPLPVTVIFCPPDMLPEMMIGIIKILTKSDKLLIGAHVTCSVAFAKWKGPLILILILSMLDYCNIRQKLLHQYNLIF